MTYHKLASVKANPRTLLESLNLICHARAVYVSLNHLRITRLVPITKDSGAMLHVSNLP